MNQFFALIKEQIINFFREKLQEIKGTCGVAATIGFTTASIPTFIQIAGGLLGIILTISALQHMKIKKEIARLEKRRNELEILKAEKELRNS